MYTESIHSCRWDVLQRYIWHHNISVFQIAISLSLNQCMLCSQHMILYAWENCNNLLDFMVNDIAECPLNWSQTSLMSCIMVWDHFSASYIARLIKCAKGSSLHNTYLLYPIPSSPFFEFSLLVCANCDLSRVS